MKFALVALAGIAAAAESQMGWGSWYGYQLAPVRPPMRPVPGYTQFENPNNALLRSLGRGDDAKGQRFFYGIQETTPCLKRGESTKKDDCKSCGYGYGYSPRCVAPVPKVKAAYAGEDHCNNRLLRSLGRDDLAHGRSFKYAEVEETPCKRGAACAYDEGCAYGKCDGQAYGSCKVCLDDCEPQEEVVVTTAEPRVIKMWDNPTFTPNVQTRSGLGGYTPGIKMVPGNAGIPGAAAEPVPVKAERPARKQVLKRDERSHVIRTTTDCGGCGYCDECESSEAPRDWAPRYSRPRYHDRRVRNYLW